MSKMGQFSIKTEFKGSVKGAFFCGNFCIFISLYQYYGK